MKTTSLIITILMLAVSVNAEMQTITWKSPEADRHEITVARFMGFYQQNPIWAEELFSSSEKSLELDFEEGYYMITIKSCLGTDCMEPSKLYHYQCVEHDTAYDIEID